MGAYNGRLMPRLIFGLPVQAVILTGLAFMLLVLLLFPAAALHPFRPFLLGGCGLMLFRAYRVMRTAHEAAILPALDRAKRMNAAKRVID